MSTDYIAKSMEVTYKTTCHMAHDMMQKMYDLPEKMLSDTEKTDEIVCTQAKRRHDTYQWGHYTSPRHGLSKEPKRGTFEKGLLDNRMPVTCQTLQYLTFLGTGPRRGQRGPLIGSSAALPLWPTNISHTKV